MTTSNIRDIQLSGTSTWTCGKCFVERTFVAATVANLEEVVVELIRGHECEDGDA